MSQALRDAARAIFARALDAVDVRSAVQSRIARGNGMLMLAGKQVPLTEVDRVLIVAMGKAAVPMHRAAAEALAGINQQAIVVGPSETLPSHEEMYTKPWNGAVYLPGAHPIPNAASLHAARLILDALTAATPKTVVLFLISGGASAMVEQPLDPAVTLDDLAQFSYVLVGSGLKITAMNDLRKHLSAVKGGRLAAAAAVAGMQCTLLISDVPAASPDAIASGPSLPGKASAAEARALFHLLQRTSTLPQSIIRWFAGNRLPETPKAGDAAFLRSHWEVILSSDHLAQAAVDAAEAKGFHAVVDNACDDWEYRDAARYLLNRSRALAAETRSKTCLVSVGEVSVTISAHHGEGGRNQQFALLLAELLAGQHEVAAVLSAGSDGIDGHSSAAGAVCDETTIARADAAEFSVKAALANFDSAPLLHTVGDAITTGPTGNNLRDLRVILMDAADDSLVRQPYQSSKNTKGPHGECGPSAFV